MYSRNCISEAHSTNCISEAPRQSRLSSLVKRSKQNEIKTSNSGDEKDMTVRGRVFDHTKPQTFNQVSFI